MEKKTDALFDLLDTLVEIVSGLEELDYYDKSRLIRLREDIAREKQDS